MTIDEIRKKLQDRNLAVVSERIGIHYNTLYRIAKGEGNPNYETLKKLEAYLNG